jgi:cyclophilin family peptidyl-prolyl cis-trans isomerase
LKKFLEDLGFDFETGDITMREACESSANREVFITINHEPSQDGQSIFARISGTAKAEL